jgi:AAA+ ATPase superfamily predicted ATPase
MKITFVNRKREMNFLLKIYNQKGPRIVILYGRRRVGKTEIIKNFLKDKDSLYFLADKRGTASNAQRFARESAQYLQDIPPDAHNFDDVFTYITARTKSIVVAIDEFSYLVEKDDTVPSVFQLIYDEILEEKDLLLILCGSSISMMEEGTLSYKSPLYGRRAGQWLVEPLRFRDIPTFFPEYTFSQVIEAFAVVGNIPAYIIKFDDSLSVFDNIREKILKRGTFLYEEIEFLLRGELRNPPRYLAILESMGSGATRVTEIADKSYISTKDLPKYLRTLQNIQLIEKKQPITRKKGKKTIYKISDQFFYFWLKFVYPHRSHLESENLDYVMEKIKTDFNSFVGLSFEKVCEEALHDLNNRKKLPCSFSKIGTWWGHYRDKKGRREVEIDIVALNEESKEILFVECKWKEKVNAETILADLKKKSGHVKWFNESRIQYFAIFAKSFSRRSKDCFCFDLTDVESVLK